jgi:hypothetical protein
MARSSGLSKVLVLVHPVFIYRPNSPLKRCLNYFSDSFLKLDFRWDEKADPPRSTLCCVGLQTYASSMWAQ